MYKQAKRSLSEISEDDTHAYKKAVKKSPRMQKEITIASNYFSRCSSSPCAQTLIKMSIDCNLVKLILMFLICMLALTLYCKRKYKRK